LSDNNKKMTNNQKLSNSEEITNISLIIGKFINLSSEIEHNINFIIAAHFFKNDAVFELNEFVLSELSLRSKCQIMINILRKRYPDIYKKYKDLISLDEMRANRNKFAHNTFYYFESKTGKKDYSKLQMNKSQDFKPAKDVMSLKEYEKVFKKSVEQLRITTNILSDIYSFNEEKLSRQ